jgi:hypothetical protein
MRKLILLAARLCEMAAKPDWRQYKHLLSKNKRMYRCAQQAKRATSKTAAGTARREKEIKDSHRKYIDESDRLLKRAEEAIKEAKGCESIAALATICSIDTYKKHAERQIDQIRRRVLEGQTIPHEEKVFSIFEPYTEWISKGKAGIPQELGLKVCVIEDQNGFMLNHRVMTNEQDVDVAVPFLEDTKKEYPNLSSCSFDKGFHSPENKKKLTDMLDEVTMPKKGKATAGQQAEEGDSNFIAARKKHSRIESAINALENHGLDRCLDHGLHGFNRYIALAVVARNIQIIGEMLWKQELQDKAKIRKSTVKVKAA